jgi:hypothetical protein
MEILKPLLLTTCESTLNGLISYAQFALNVSGLSIN